MSRQPLPSRRRSMPAGLGTGGETRCRGDTVDSRVASLWLVAMTELTCDARAGSARNLRRPRELAMPTSIGIAKLWKPVVNVSDLDEGERFWAALTGLSPTGRHGGDKGDQYSSLEDVAGGDDAPWLLLQLVSRDQAS